MSKTKPVVEQKIKVLHFEGNLPVREWSDADKIREKLESIGFNAVRFKYPKTE